MARTRFFALLLTLSMVLSLSNFGLAAQPGETADPAPAETAAAIPEEESPDLGTETDVPAPASTEDDAQEGPSKEAEAAAPGDGPAEKSAPAEGAERLSVDEEEPAPGETEEPALAALSEGGADGAGTQDDPYLIKTEEDLLAVGNAPAAFYRLENDISLTAESWTPIGLSTPFSGVFDGNGHTVSGLRVSDASYRYTGLFGQVTGTIKNLTVEGSVSGSNYVGILVGYDKGAITNCFTSGTAQNTGSGDTGGMVGYHASGNITACGSDAAVTGKTSDTGGLIGDNHAQVTNCYAQGSVNGGSGPAGGLIGYNEAYVRNCYAAGNVTTSSSYKGGLIGSGTSDVYNCYCRTISGGKPTGFSVTLEELKDKATFAYWDFTNLWAMDGGFPYIDYRGPERTISFAGEGSADVPYLIETEDQLYQLAMNFTATPNSSDVYYQLAKDIRITAKNWTPIGVFAEFKANFDGAGHKITGLNCAGTNYQYVGLFGRTSGTIKNLTVEGSVSGSNYVGILVGYDKGAITNCFTSGTAQNTGSGDTGGMVGYHASGNITACGSDAAVTGKTGDTGGLIGDNHAQVTNCYAQGSVNGGSGPTGGLIGYNEAYVRNCYAAGNVTTSSSYKGGLIGSGTSDVYNCYCRTISGGKPTGFSVTLEELKDKATFAYWDFTNLWAMDGGFPYIDYRGPERTISFAGEGNADVPYLIETEDQLYQLAMNFTATPNSSDVYYQLAKDIQITAKNWTPIGVFAEFKANFDGAGHKITGLNCAGTNYQYVGLFGRTSGAIKNLTVEGSVSGSNYAGILVGYDKGAITNCFTSGTAQNTGSGDTGGMVGYHASGNITACGSDAAVTGKTGDTGGLIGDNHAQVTNCYAQGSVNGGSGPTGGLIGYNEAYVRNCYAAGNVTTSSSYKGGLIGSGTSDVYNCYCRTISGGKPTGFSVTLEELKDKATFAYWDFTNLWAMDGGFPYIDYRGPERTISFAGEGNADVPYLIETEDQLYQLAMNFTATPNSSDVYYQLAKDIQITAKNWTPIGVFAEFKANFDGAGHKITGLNCAGTNYQYVGLFGRTSGTIKNLTVEGSVSGSNYAGILVGYDKGAITNCFTSGTAQNTGSGDTGGLVGYHASGNITACGSDAAVTGKTSDTGGLIGDNHAQVTNCYAQGSVNGGSGPAGGLIGYNEAYVRNCYAAGNVTTSSSYKGGLIGSGTSNVYNCYCRTISGGKLTGFSVTLEELKDKATFAYWDFTNLWAMDGGFPYIDYRGPERTISFAGEGNADVPYLIETEDQLYQLAMNFTATPNSSDVYYQLAKDIRITAKNWTPIGVFAEFKANFDGAGHKITGLNCAGTNYFYVGLFGHTSGAIKNLTVEGSVSGSNYVGILAGYAEKGGITNCFTSGTAQNTGSGVTGGLVGWSNTTISACGSTATVTGKSGDTGGLIGESRFHMLNCYARGDVNGGSGSTGGLVGVNMDFIRNCYATGRVTTTSSNKGGLVGINGSNLTAVITSAYYNSGTSTATDTGKGTPATTAEMKTRSTYNDWDFDKVWGMDATINDGYPYLQANPPGSQPSTTVSVTGVSLDRTALTLHVHETAALTATVQPADASNPAVTWESSAPAVATVDKGVVTAVSSGTATITVTTKDGGKTATCEVTVKSVVHTVSISPDYSLELGKTMDLSALNTVQKYSDKGTWTWKLGDPTVASVTAEGIVTGLKLGTTTLSGSLEYSDATTDYQVQYSFTLDVVKPVIPINSVALDRDHLDLHPGDTDSLTATFTPANATVDEKTWTSSDERVVTVSDTGVVTAVGVGEATITFQATYYRSQGFTGVGQSEVAECTVTVTDAPAAKELTQITITGPSNTKNLQGLPLDVTGLVVTAHYSDGTASEVTDYTLSGYDADRLGKQTITVEYETVSAQFQIEVVEKAVSGITITGKPDKLVYAYGEELDTTGLVVTAQYNDGSSQTIASGYTVTGYDKTVSGSQSVTVSYQGFTAGFTVTVGEKPATGSVAKPMFSIESFLGGKRVTLTAPEGAIYYTLDGSAPTAASTKYTGPIELTATATVKAIAVLGGVSSNVTSARITVSQVAAPVASPVGGTVDPGTIVTLRSDTVGAAIYYTTDGSTPSPVSPASVKYTGAVLIQSNLTLKAVAVKDGYVGSAVTEETYKVPEPPADEVIIALGAVTVPAGNTASVPVYLFPASDAPISSFRFTVTFDQNQFDSGVTITPAEGVDASELFSATNGGKVTLMYNGETPLQGGEICTVNLTTLASLAPDTLCPVQVQTEKATVSVEGFERVTLRTADAGITITESQLATESLLTNLPDGSMETSISIYNDETESQTQLTSANLYLVVYDRNGRMVSADHWTVDLTDPMLLFTQTLRIPDGVEVGSIKVMLLSDEMTPLMCVNDIFAASLRPVSIVKKPVIYLYPEAELEASVDLDFQGELTCTYPAYHDGWQVTAAPDGTLTDQKGLTYSYLYWEGESRIDYDFSQGFCVAGQDTAAFLEQALPQLGLNRKEANDFITYWLPEMQNNPYNLISFQGAAYTDAAKLTVTPAPDTMIRVFMAWKPLDQACQIAPQTLSAPARTGFTVVEWGGAEAGV